MPDVAVIVVNYNGGPCIEPCLAAVLAQRPRPAEVMVVDNASSDGSADRLPAGVGLLRAGANEGFAAAVNRGLAATTAAFVCLLNPDVVLQPGCLAAAAAGLQADAGLGSVAPRVLLAADPSRVDASAIGLTSRFGQINRDHGRAVADLEDEPVEVLGPLGGACLWRRQALEQVGGACPSYFLYWEDMDLALRANRAGWRCRTAPAARALHLGGGSVGRGSTTNVFYMVRNHWACLLAAAPGSLLARRPLALLLAPVRAAALYAARGRPGSALAGLVCGLGRLPGALRRRRCLPEPLGGAQAAARVAALMADADANRRVLKAASARPEGRARGASP